MSDNAPSLAELLAFYVDAGVDDALLDRPVDRTLSAAARKPEKQPDREPAAPRERSVPQPSRPPAIPAVPDERQVMLARELAGGAATLDELRAVMQDFEGCNLRFTAKSLVFADGNPEASLMIVGEAPGRDEDLEGRPFVGRSGKLLDRMLAAIGRDRTSCFIANVVPWRPPGNRDPSPMETEICRPFIERQIELVAPRVLVTLGNPSTKALLRVPGGITGTRGRWHAFKTAAGTEIAAMPTFHPAYLLRNPGHKKLAWRDFLEIKSRLASA